VDDSENNVERSFRLLQFKVEPRIDRLIVSPATCLHCGHEWEDQSFENEYSAAECPKCKRCSGIPKHLITPEEDWWHCNCGNDLFFVTRNGFFCPRCGRRINFGSE